MAQTPDHLTNDNTDNFVGDYVSSNDPDVVIIAGEESVVPTGEDVLVDPAAPTGMGSSFASPQVGSASGDYVTQGVENYAMNAGTSAGTPGFTGSETTNAGGQNDVNDANDANITSTSSASAGSSASANNDQDWQNSDNPTQIRNDIDDTRSQLSQTLNAIEDRLNPQRLTEQAKDVVHDATIGRAEQVVNNVEMSAKQAGNNLLDTIKENPLPAALVGIGLGWLIMKARNNAQSQNQYGYQGYRGYNQGNNRGYRGQNWNRGYGYQGYDGQGPYVYGYGAGYSGNNNNGASNGLGNAAQNVQNQASNAVNNLQNQASNAVQNVQDKASQVSNQVQNTAGQISDSVQNTAGQVADSVQNTAQQVGYQAQVQAQRAQGWFEDTMQSSPLSLGAIALAAGVAAGLLIPETQAEDRVMGPARDTLLQKAADTAQDTIQKVESVGQAAGQAAKNAAQQEASNQGLTSGSASH